MSTAFNVTTTNKQQDESLIDTELATNNLYVLINQERDKYNLPHLNFDGLLNKAALEKANDMVNDNYWAHVSPSGKTPWYFINKVGYKYIDAGENLAKNFNSTKAVIKSWMASSEHKSNIINPNFTDIGIAIIQGTIYNTKTTLIVSMYGSKVNQ